MKPLKPSMKEKKRYLLIKGKNLKTNVPKAIKDFVGDLGIAKANPSFIKAGSGWVVLAVNRKSLEAVRASIAMWPDKMVVEKVSGTLKGLNSRKKK